MHRAPLSYPVRDGSFQMGGGVYFEGNSEIRVIQKTKRERQYVVVMNGGIFKGNYIT